MAGECRSVMIVTLGNGAELRDELEPPPRSSRVGTRRPRHARDQRCRNLFRVFPVVDKPGELRWAIEVEPMHETFRETIAPALAQNLRDHFAAVLKEPLPPILRGGLDGLELVFRPELLIASGPPIKVNFREVAGRFAPARFSR